jgi:fatty acid desaturase
MPSGLELTPASLSRRFAADFVPRPAIYWCDFLASAALGWSAFVASGLVATWPLALGLLAVATLALYRAVLFIHEVAHLRSGAVRRFPLVWNLLAGFPLMVPSIMYAGSHADHHKRTTYGTLLDPEYEPIAYWSPWRIVASTLLMTVLPAAVALRWGVIGPVSLLVPRLRPFVVGRMSTLVINASYRREEPRDRERRRWLAKEIGAAVTFWLGAGLVAAGILDPSWVVRWYAVGTGILVMNHLRTLAAHRYEGRGDTMDVTEQLLDTVNLEGVPGLTVLLAPVGLRYHGLHHLLPSLPYHSLRRVHRALLAELPDDSPYRRTEAFGLGAALRQLIATARDNARAGVGAEVALAFRRDGLSEARAAAAGAAGSEPRTGSAAGAGAG